MEYRGLSICIPAYNEAGAIGQALRDLRAQFPEAQIIVVDDGSRDATADEAGTVEGVTLIRHNSNRGYGASIKTAVRHATGRAVAWYDADGQHRPRDLARVVRPVLNGSKDAVIGRRVRGSTVRPERVPGKLVLRLVAELVARERIPDLNCGLRCFRRDVIARYLHLLPDGFSASTTSTLLMIKRGYRLGYARIVARPREGTSTVRQFRDGLGTLHLIVRLLVLFEAFKFFTLLSALQVIPGMAYGLFKVFTIRQGFPTFASTVVISGVLTFLMGLVCDQITALRQERFEHD